jgi:hypothetical protein
VRLRLKAARRKFAAPQTVIVSERRSREPNDQDRRSPLCSPLPASLSQRPHPPNTFVDNKGPTPIRPSGHRAVEALFSRFSAVQSGPISACFFRFYCSVGRGSQAFSSTEYQVLSTNFWPAASSLQFVKDQGPRTHLSLKPNIAIYHLFAHWSRGNHVSLSFSLCLRSG